MNPETYSLVQELTIKYTVNEISRNETEILIRIPKKYESLWLLKLSNLRTTDTEIKKYSGEY